MRTTIVLAALIAGCCIILAGCEATAKSDRMEPTWQPTASYETIFAKTATTSPIERRKWAKTYARYEPCIVTHFASYFDDEFVTMGDGNDTHGWTIMDAAAVAYSPARFVVNVLAVPVSMIKDPPGVLVCGNLDAHDAGSCDE